MFLKENNRRQHIPWSSQEKDFLVAYASQTPRTTETVNGYWEKFAVQLNVKFPGNNRKGKSKTIILHSFFDKFLLLNPIQGIFKIILRLCS